MVTGRPARLPVPALLTSLLVLLLLAPAFSLAGAGLAAQEVDQALLMEDVLAEMAAAGTYRLLRYDVRNNDRRLEAVGEIDLRQGGKLVALADGEITTTAAGTAEGEPANDGAFRFYAAGGEGWAFDRMEKSGGELVYVFRQAPPVAGGERTARTSQLVIAATTLLPLSYLESGSGPAGPYAEQTIYIDFGDPVGTAATGGTPVAGATPVAAGCGNAASAPIEIAEAFVAAATTLDLDRASMCFAPGRQPATWGDAFLGGEGDVSDDVSDCRGVPYTVYESKIRPDFSAVVFLFNQACAVAVLDPWQRDLYDVDTLPVTTLLVQMHRHDQRWYVQDALAMVPD